MILAMGENIPRTARPHRSESTANASALRPEFLNTFHAP
jgi:hypothetical protein